MRLVFSEKLSEGFYYFQCGLVIGFLRYVLDIFDVSDHPFAVDDDDPSSQQPELFDDESVFHPEIEVAVVRVDVDIFDMFRGAEPFLGEW